MKPLTSPLFAAALFLSAPAGAFAAAHHPPGPERAALAQLVSDLRELKAGSEVTAAQRQALAADFALLSTSPTPPSPESRDQLAEDLADAFASAARTGEVSDEQKAALVLDIGAVFNSAGLSADQAAQFVADAHALLLASGVDAGDVQTIADDLAVVAASARETFLAKETAFPLTSPDASRGSGRAQLSGAVRDGGARAAVLSIETVGLPGGVYTVRASADGDPVTLGTLRVFGRRAGIGAAVFGGVVGGQPFPDGFRSGSLDQVTILDASGAVQLTGSVAAASKIVVGGNFRLEAGPAAPDALGDAAFKVKVKDGLAREHFLLYAAKLPATAALTLKINGAPVATVNTNAKGRLLIVAGRVVLPVKADGVTPLLSPTLLPDGVDLTTLTALELDDAQGGVVATAGLSF